MPHTDLRVDQLDNSEMTIEFETTIPAPLENVFAFFCRPSNLAHLMDEWPGFRMIRCEDTVCVGTQFWIEQNVYSILPVAMGFEITHLEQGLSFSESMIHGPFSRFTHIHSFFTHMEGTRIQDRLDASLKWPYGGEPATRYLVAPKLLEMFAYRSTRLQTLAPLMADAAL